MIESENLQKISKKKFSSNPMQVEARTDFPDITFELTGLPEDDLDNIKAEYLFLGGYFS